MKKVKFLNNILDQPNILSKSIYSNQYKDTSNNYKRKRISTSTNQQVYNKFIRYQRMMR